MHFNQTYYNLSNLNRQNALKRRDLINITVHTYNNLGNLQMLISVKQRLPKLYNFFANFVTYQT